MGSTGLQITGLILGVLSWMGMIVTCASPEWRKNSKGQSVIDKTTRYEGLWNQCEAYSTGETHCSVYTQFFIGLPGVLQVCRALMISSIVVGFIAILITIPGLRCTSIGNSSNPSGKAKAAISGGFLFLVAAVLNGASVSYYANGVVQEYYNPVFNKNMPMHFRMEYGSALFVGWAALVVGILGSLILVITSIFVLMGLKAVKRERSLIRDKRVTENRSLQTNQERQRHLPMAHQHRVVHKRVQPSGARPQDEATRLTKQHIAQHNSQIASRNGHSHHHHHGHRHHTNTSMSNKQEHTAAKVGEAVRSSEERRRWSDENPVGKQSFTQPDGARQHRYNDYRQQNRMNSSKSEGQIKHRSGNDAERESRPSHFHDEDEINGGYKRRRPAKEYV